MKKKLLRILLISVMVFSLVGCTYEETKEYELLTIRRYAEVEESGLFTTKKETYWFIEVVYKTEEGIAKYEFEERFKDLAVGEENKVVLQQGEMSPNVIVTLEKYRELYGIE